ncbi:MAG: YbaB/EbfC family nucleoid-associated protein [Leptospirales bacterium]
MADFNFADILKNLGGDFGKQLGDIKGQVDQVRERLSKMSITGEAGAGMVRVSVNGEGQVQSVDIDPALLTPNDKARVEELIISAVNDASRRAKETVAHEMKSVAGGLPIPGLEKLFGM